LLRIEVIRAVSRAMPAVLPDARALLQAFDYVSIDDEVVDAAMNEPDRMLRSLDAIHLATARVLGPDLDGLATYDDRLAAAAKDAGIAVIDPRD
jgi:predicted nucleic acid-binding protein